MADSQMFRWIDELNGIVDADAQVKQIRKEINAIKKEQNSPGNKRKIKELYNNLSNLQFHTDYMCLIIDRNKHYYRACRGFSINGVEYRRLLGTNGGVKTGTIVFVSARLADELNRRIENGRDPDKPLVTAKLEAYKALTCSASIPVSFPKGVMVVNDYNTTFHTDIVSLRNQEVGEPVMEFKHDQEVTIDASDGCGMMLPSLAERWSRELNLDYTVSGVNTRFSFEKGMVFTFDFIDFAAREAGGNYIVKDVWGHDVDIRNVELILTESMLKLWDSYDSCESYMNNCIKNHYTFGIAKVTPRVLDSERALNYQFIQSYDLSDDDIEELISPTMEEIRDVLGGDWKKTVLFLKGSGLNENNISKLEDDAIKALMIDHSFVNDSYVKQVVYRAIRNRIDEAKVGVVNVHGNYSIICGDLYGLCQSIFGLEVTGLLKAGEIYNEYWADNGEPNLVCFRAPMTCHANIRAVHPAMGDDVRYWFRYIHTGTIFNAWDTATASLNGADFDGDIAFLTDNQVLVRKHVPLPTIMCEQHRAEKRVSTEKDFIDTNIGSFGNDIGKITNRVTSMFEIQSRFDKGSDEYKVLDYRIKCGQLLQQDAIDKAKGIISKPMPRNWYDTHNVNKMENDEQRSFYSEIVADRKPYFMRYIYPELKKEYRNYTKNADMNALREFDMTIAEMEALPYEELSDRQTEFLRYYRNNMPVGIGGCVMNKICHRFEDEFDSYIADKNAKADFDYSIMKSGAEYSERRMYAITNLYNEYLYKLRQYKAFASYERVDKIDASSELDQITAEFRRECAEECPNEATLCDIVVDICYSHNATKKFAWDMCGSTIIHNLLEKHDGYIEYPVESSEGFTFNQDTYTLQKTRIEDDADDHTERERVG